MKITELVKLINGTFITCEENADVEVDSAFASDMMSEVLAYAKDQCVLITGLANPQVVRTAEMMDMFCIVLVRGKKPDSIMIDLAKKKNIAFICTDKTMFETSGILYKAGLKA